MAAPPQRQQQCSQRTPPSRLPRDMFGGVCLVTHMVIKAGAECPTLTGVLLWVRLLMQVSKDLIVDIERMHCLAAAVAMHLRSLRPELASMCDMIGKERYVAGAHWLFRRILSSVSTLCFLDTLHACAPEQCIELVQQLPRCMAGNKQVWLAAVMRNGLALYSAPEWARNDPHIVEAAARQQCGTMASPT